MEDRIKCDKIKGTCGGIGMEDTEREAEILKQEGTKKQKRTVWIAAVVAVVLFIAVSFLLSLAGIDMFSLLGGNPAMQ